MRESPETTRCASPHARRPTDSGSRSISVLLGANLHAAQRAQILEAIHLTAIARAATNNLPRRSGASIRARSRAAIAENAFGTGLTFELGEGNLAF